VHTRTAAIDCIVSQGRLHKGGMVRDAPWRKLGGGMLWW